MSDENAVENRVRHFDGLTDEVVELILARLPVTSLGIAGQVSKSWSSLTRTDKFAEFYDKASSRKSWFFQCCVNFLTPEKNQGYGFDPETQQWHQISADCFPQDRHIAFAGSQEGCFYHISGLTDLNYKREFISTLWEQAPAMHYSRNGPLLGVVGGADGDAHKLIVAGGVTFLEEDDLAVEVYDSEVGEWELCQSVPGQFRGNCSLHWMTSAVAGGRFYIANKYMGGIAFFDLEKKRWSPFHHVRPLGVVRSHLFALEGKLHMAGSFFSGDIESFKIWEVNHDTMECGAFVTSMPQELYKGFDHSEENGCKGGGLECMANGDLLYVFVQVNSREQAKNSRVVVCDLSSMTPSWTLLPPLPASSSYNHVVGFASPVKFSSLLSR
jgi:hypothetical protein